MVRLFGDMAITKAPNMILSYLYKNRGHFLTPSYLKNKQLFSKNQSEIVKWWITNCFFDPMKFLFKIYQFVVLYIFKLKLPQKTFDHHRMFVLAREKIATLINFLE